MRREKNINIHLNRQELLQAARGEEDRLDHLKQCRECREIVQLLKAYPVAGQQPLPDAPAALIDRAIAIAGEVSPIKKAQRRLARLIFDSWLIPHPVGVRGTESLDHRRLRFDARGVVLDLRAERLSDAWVFTAQLTGTDVSKAIVTPSPGRKPVFADQGGLFLWTSKRPPQKLSLQFEKTVIEFPELSWKKPRST